DRSGKMRSMGTDRRCVLAFVLAAAALAGRSAAAQTPPSDGWTLSTHGYAFLTANRQGGPSGEREFESQNHFMLRASRGFLGGQPTLRGTFRVEPLTIPPRGSRELFQRGETYDGVLLVDRQHPHDLFVELGAAWERSFGYTSVRLYAAPVGEPAIGP